MIFRKFIGERGKIVRKLFERKAVVTWFITACQLGEFTDKFRIDTKFEDQYLTITAPSSSQGDQSKLGGPEESLFERSPGVGREERPPIAVVVQSSSRFCYLTVFGFNNCEWLNVMFVVYDIRFSWFSDVNVLFQQ